MTAGGMASVPADAPVTDEAGSPSTELLEQLGRSFKATTAAVRRLRGSERHRAGQLRDAQYTLLFGLRDHEALPSSELAHLAGLSPATATEMLDALEQAGLVNRARSERDRRVVLVSLSQRGRELVEERHRHFEPRWRTAFSSFSEEELSASVAVLERMRELFEELAEAGWGGPDDPPPAQDQPRR